MAESDQNDHFHTNRNFEYITNIEFFDSKGNLLHSKHGAYSIPADTVGKGIISILYLKKPVLKFNTT